MSQTANPNPNHYEWFAHRFRSLGEAVGTVVKGNRRAVDLALATLMAEGHLLIEDVPGTGKTTLARTLAGCIGGNWNRIQFTPDLLPSDVTGVSVWNQGSGAFEFRPGPIFTNLVVADEINRASPKTQAALLEVMEERQVTSDGTTRAVGRPFMVIATQNPVEHQGTYRLPEAQLDRFLTQISLGYPDHEAEMAVIDMVLSGGTTRPVPVACSVEEAEQMIAVAKTVQVAPALKDYAVRLVASTRSHERVKLGASPRSTVALIRAAQVAGAAAGRHYVSPQDVKAMATPVLAHRLILSDGVSVSMEDRHAIVDAILGTVAVPAERPVG